MSNSYICKDCNYESETEGLCPYCDMTMEPIDSIDETTSEAKYQDNEIKAVENATKGDIDYASSPASSNKDENLLEDDEIDEIIEQNGS